jgi:hypothetical protein
MDVFLMADVPRDVAKMLYQKTQQKINASLARLLRAFLAHSG